MKWRLLVSVLVAAALFIPGFVVNSSASTDQIAGPQTTENELEPYTYQSAGRRDPFLPLASKKASVIQDRQRPLEPLEKFDIEQLRLQALMLGIGKPRAMVRAPDGKSYIVAPGGRMGKNQGIVESITSKEIIIKESYFDFLGEVRSSVKRIALPEQEGK